MMRIEPTPDRASRDATAEPVAPHPTTATWASARRFCPSAPTPRNKICREYLSSSSKDITNPEPRNHYYKSRRRSLSPSSGFDGWMERREFRLIDNIAFHSFIETVSHPSGQGEFLRARRALCAVGIVSLLALAAFSQDTPTTPPASPQQGVAPPTDQTQQAAPAPNPALGPISSYLGVPVTEIRFTHVPVREQDHLRRLLPQKVGQPLDRDHVRDSVKIFFNTGLFAR